jgi:hypothetical protein
MAYSGDTIQVILEYQYDVPGFYKNWIPACAGMTDTGGVHIPKFGFDGTDIVDEDQAIISF